MGWAERANKNPRLPRPARVSSAQERDRMRGLALPALLNKLLGVELLGKTQPTKKHRVRR